MDAYLIDLADTHTFRRADFTETDQGHCRILAPLTHRLAETLPQWAAAVAAPAETVAHALADASERPIRKATPLTSDVRRRTSVEASASRRRPTTDRGDSSPRPSTPRPTVHGPVCIDCGSPLARRQRTYCPDCWPARRLQASKIGVQAAAHTLTDPEAQRSRGEAIAAGKAAARARRIEALGWQPDDWTRLLAPRVAALTLDEIRSATGLSLTQASRIKRGTQVPPPRHWKALLDLLAKRGPG